MILSVTRLAAFALLAVGLSAADAYAQKALELMRFQGASGILIQGNIAKAELFADFSAFGGQITERSNGDLDVDPTFWSGLEGTYRLSERLSLGGSWMHSRGRYRITFPSLSRDPGEFDLEGFILAAQDFSTQAIGGSRAERAMTDAITDTYLLSATFEIPHLRRNFFPYARVGAGMFRQKSDGHIFRFEFEGPRPPGFQISEIFGGSVERDGFGLPDLTVDETNLLISFGGGVRASLGSKWSCELSLEDLVRVSPELSNLTGEVPRPDEGEGGPNQRFFAVGVRAADASLIHNFGVRLAIGYAIWPFGVPR